MFIYSITLVFLGIRCLSFLMNSKPTQSWELKTFMVVVSIFGVGDFAIYDKRSKLI